MRNPMLSLLFVGILMSAVVYAQQPEWLFKNHKYHRMKTGSSMISVDNTRSTILFDGGPYDTYATSDGGKSWRTIFDTKMFFIDVASRWTIDRAGRWYYNGRLYLKLPVNLVSDDAGATMRFLVKDTAEFGFNGRWEVDPYHIPPNSVSFDLYSFPEPFNGVFISCNGGGSWTKCVPPVKGKSYQADMHMKPIRSGVFALLDSNFNTIEVDACTGAQTPTAISGRSRWVQLANGTIVQLALAKNAIGIRKPGSQQFQYDTMTTVTGDTTRYRISTAYLDLINDTLAVIFGRNGEVWTVGPDATLRSLFVPKRYSKFQQITAAGAYGDLFVAKFYNPEGDIATGTAYVVLNTKTGNVDIHRRTSANESWGFINTLDRYQMVPYSDSVWFAGFNSGELLTTTDAGKTWRLVSNIEPDPQWGSRSIGIDRIYPRGDGSMALLTEHTRVMVKNEQTSSWDIIIPGPFQHKIKMASNTYGHLTRSNDYFGEDHNRHYRHRYGPSQLFFPHPDTAWVTGDVVARYAANGTFVDTILPRRSRLVKRLSSDVIVSAMDSVFFSFNEGREWVYVSNTMPVIKYDTVSTTAGLGDIILANNGNIIAGLRGMQIYEEDGVLRDTTPGGIVGSSDGGSTWRRITTSIDTTLYVSSLHKTSSGTLLCLASEVRIDPWYIDTRGERRRYESRGIQDKCYQLDQSYVFRSTDNGVTWTRTFIFPDRAALAQTDIRFIDMPDGRIMALHPTFGVAISSDDGLRWSVGDPLNIGNPVVNDVLFTNDGYAHFATSDGYCRLKISDIVNVQEFNPTTADHQFTARITSAGILEASTQSPLQSLTVYSTDGRLITSMTGETTNAALDMSGCSQGAYIAVAVINGNPVARIVVR